MKPRSLLLLASLLAFPLVACSGNDPHDAGGDVVVDEGHDVANDLANDAVADATTDAPIDTADDLVEHDADAGDVAVDAVDAVSDAVDPTSISAMLTGSVLSQNCQPEVAMDPVTIQGAIRVTNNGGVAIGPIHATAGAVISEATLTQIATFSITANDIAVVNGGGATGSTDFAKDADSLTPADHCNTLACGSPVRLAIDLAGPGVPAGLRAYSPPMVVQCAF